MQYEKAGLRRVILDLYFS